MLYEAHHSKEFGRLQGISGFSKVPRFPLFSRLMTVSPFLRGCEFCGMIGYVTCSLYYMLHQVLLLPGSVADKIHGPQIDPCWWYEAGAEFLPYLPMERASPGYIPVFCSSSHHTRGSSRSSGQNLQGLYIYIMKRYWTIWEI